MSLRKIIQSEGTLLNTIDGNENWILPTGVSLPNNVEKQVDFFKEITDRVLPLNEIESRLKELFGAGKVIMTGENERFASCIGWGNTQLHRSSDNIIIPGSKMEGHNECQINMKGNIIDPIGWASRTAAPNDYGLLGKIPELRGLEGNEKFDTELHNYIMNLRVGITEILAYACEINKNETVIMPVVKLIGGDDIIKSSYNEEKNENDISTAKYAILNAKLF